jgi:succinate-semialdehyde dehydrogenase/glutarate-semialdehyde dehydrogenase
MAHTELLIAGEWVDGRGDQPLSVHSPATGDHLADVSVANDADVDATVAAAREAQVALEAMPPFERADRLHRVADHLEARAEELARQLTTEQGKPIATEARGEIEESAEIFRWAAEEVKRLETPVLPGADPDKKVLTFRRANGVYAVITPWNFPMNIPAELLAPGLGGGNAVILKPSEFTPLTGAALVEACLDADFPPGSISILQGGGDVGGRLVSHDGVDAVAFVGSMQTADRIVRAAGLKRTLIEASGNGPQIVCDDADLEAAAEAAVYGAEFASGQCCVATERLLVQESVHDELLELILARAGRCVLGDPLDEATTLGPLNNEPVAAKMDTHLADAADRGYEVLAGGARADGWPTDLYYPLTVVDGVGAEGLLFTDESFGPVVPLTTFRDDEDAIALANSSPLGLQAAVFTSSLTRSFRYIDRLNAGTVIVNDSTCFWEPHPPFGGASGTKTGWGRIGGKYTLLDMTDLRAAVIDVKKTRG